VIQERNPNLKIVLIEDIQVLPEQVREQVISSILVVRHPIFAEFVGIVENVIITHNREEETSELTIDQDQTEKDLKQALRSGHLDFIDAMNVEFYSTFERPIVAIVTTHASVDDLSKNIPFYRTLARFLHEGGLKKHPQYDYAIINALEVTDI
jgi:hypothetical protein